MSIIRKKICSNDEVGTIRYNNKLTIANLYAIALKIFFDAGGKNFHQLALIGAHQLALIGAITMFEDKGNIVLAPERKCQKMSFSNMLEILQAKDKEKIILMQTGIFYIATGRDANLLHKRFNLKCTCYKNNICKVGIPVSSLDKYIEKLNKIKYAYIIYDYDKENKELKIRHQKDGRKVKITENNINCLMCKGIKKYPEDEYMLALAKFLKPSEEEDIKNEN